MKSDIILLNKALGPLGANCFIFGSKGPQKPNNVIIIDPGFESSFVQNSIVKHDLTPKAILLTHAHYDHIGHVNFLSKQYGIPIYIHKKGLDALKDPDLNMSTFFSEEIIIDSANGLSDGDTIDISASLSLKVIYTPGHSECSSCFYTNGALFSGDTIFDSGFGRYDLPGSSYEALHKSINRLFELPDDTIIYPGHGSKTTIAQSKIDLSHFRL